MKGHGLMQAIARVNRVFRNKPAGLVVDYIGLAADLKAALAHYSASDQARTGVDTRQAVEALITALDVIRAMFTGVDYMAAVHGTPADRLQILPQAIERALTIEREARPPMTPTTKPRERRAGSASSTPRRRS